MKNVTESVKIVKNHLTTVPNVDITEIQSKPVHVQPTISLKLISLVEYVHTNVLNVLPPQKTVPNVQLTLTD